jgi:hypothetical protein
LIVVKARPAPAAAGFLMGAAVPRDAAIIRPVAGHFARQLIR